MLSTLTRRLMATLVGGSLLLAPLATRADAPGQVTGAADTVAGTGFVPPAGLKEIGPAGGTISYGGWSLTVPPGDFAVPTEVQLELLASNGPSIFSSLAPDVAEDRPWPILSFPTPARPLTLSVYLSPDAAAQMTAGGSPDRLTIWGSPEGHSRGVWVGGRVYADPRGVQVETQVYWPGSYTLAADPFAYDDLSGLNFANVSNSDLFSEPISVLTSMTAYKAAIDHLLAAGIVQGYVLPRWDQGEAEWLDGHFRPSAIVTRAEFAKMLVLAAGLPPGDPAANGFSDVPATAWYAPYVTAARQAGFLAGVASGRFDPAGRLTLEEAVTALIRLPQPAASPSPVSPRPDLNVHDWARAGIGLALARGWITQHPDDSFQFFGAITRADAAVLLADYLTAIGKI